MSNQLSTWGGGYAITTTTGTGGFTTIDNLTVEYLREAKRKLALYGSYPIYGKCADVWTLDETTTVPKDTMTIPEPKSVQCPKCEHRAIKSSLGADWTMDVTDHDVTQTAEKRVAKENGNRARLRICAKCGNVWATILRTEEA